MKIVILVTSLTDKPSVTNLFFFLTSQDLNVGPTLKSWQPTSH